MGVGGGLRLTRALLPTGSLHCRSGCARQQLGQALFGSLAVLDAAHHRHWPGVLKVVSGCHISLFQIPLPEDGMQFGGSMSLHGNHMTLACFHGPNFRSKSWALFHLEEPNIAFWTEAQKIWEDGKLAHFKLLLFPVS